MKIEKGMYVRTKNGKIRKIISIYPTGDLFLESNTCYKKENIVGKPSFYPIDLIKVGDYVNGEIVGYIDDLEGSMRQFKYDYEDVMDRGHWNEEIETIVTKECFENNCYKVGD